MHLRVCHLELRFEGELELRDRVPDTHLVYVLGESKRVAHRQVVRLIVIAARPIDLLERFCQPQATLPHPRPHGLSGLTVASKGGTPGAARVARACARRTPSINATVETLCCSNLPARHSLRW